MDFIGSFYFNNKMISLKFFIYKLLSLLILKLKIKHARLKQFYDYYIEAICFAGKNRFQAERRGG